MLRMPAFGPAGPWRDRLVFRRPWSRSRASPRRPASDGAPLVPRGPCDRIGGMYALRLLVALANARTPAKAGRRSPPARQRAPTHGREVIEDSATGRVLTARATTARRAPKGSTAATGKEQWLAVSVATDEQWYALVDALGARCGLRTGSRRMPAGAGGTGSTPSSGAWARRALGETVDLLIGRGVPAAAVAEPSISTKPQIQARGLHEESRSVAGTDLI